MDKPSFAAAEDVIAVDISWLAARSTYYFGISGDDGFAEMDLGKHRVFGGDEPQSKVFSGTGLQPSVGVPEAANERTGHGHWNDPAAQVMRMLVDLQGPPFEGAEVGMRWQLVQTIAIGALAPLRVVRLPGKR